MINEGDLWSNWFQNDGGRAGDWNMDQIFWCKQNLDVMEQRIISNEYRKGDGNVCGKFREHRLFSPKERFLYKVLQVAGVT